MVYFNKLLEKLIKYSGARISEKELKEIIAVEEYDEYYNAVMELVSRGNLTPVKSSGSNGMRPPLHKRYMIVKPVKKYDELIPEIRLLQGRLNIEGYLANLEKYEAHRHWLLPLDAFLKNNSIDLDIPLSVNERSFQIFSREKALKEDKGLIAVLNFNQGLREALNCYNTPEPFFTHNISSREADVQNEPFSKKKLNILIIENKDTWYTLRNRMSYKKSCIAGIPFDSLIYGEGKKISRKVDSLTEVDKSFFKAAETVYYYFGDLDYEGIGIVYELMAANPALQIRLMLPLYTAMLDAAKNLNLPMTKEKQSKKAIEWFISLFDIEHHRLIENILESGRYIPQEILNNSVFTRMLHENGDVGKENV